MSKYQPFNDLPAAQFQGLVNDVAARGVLLPIIVDEDGKVIDGHQRRRAAAEAGVDCPQVVVEGLSEDEKQTLALTLNLFRRHLAGVERSKALQQLANLGMSTRRMADILGVSKSTVHRDLSELSHAGQLDRPDRVEGADGKSRPATMPEREQPPSNIDEHGEIVEPGGADGGATPTPPGSTLIESGGSPAPHGDGQAAAASAPTSVNPPDSRSAFNPTLVLMADLSRKRADVAKWLAFDRHEQVIASMDAEQRHDYRTFVLSVFNHASATLDHLDAPARLKAVQ